MIDVEKKREERSGREEVEKWQRKIINQLQIETAIKTENVIFFLF